ncbi:hypothetical protein FRC08_003902 [Ceratobasidium sp. 394]|nr:hypothetical protein FRC08_003902 [Ceratobasidium sp. 394]
MRCTVPLSYRLVLVHWTTEYKDETSELREAERQIYYGTVSGLWQRRILGRMDVYVFGTVHAAFQIGVYAARWQKRSTGPSNKECDPDPKSKSPVPAATQSDTSDKSLRYHLSAHCWTCPVHRAKLARGAEGHQLHKAGEVTVARRNQAQSTHPLTKDDHASDKESVKQMGGENDDYEVVSTTTTSNSTNDSQPLT